MLKTNRTVMPLEPSLPSPCPPVSRQGFRIPPRLGFRKVAARNLVLVAKQRQGHLADFRKIADIIGEQAPDIRPVVVRDRPYNSLRLDTVWKPTLIVSPLELKKFHPLRGTIVQNKLHTKSKEYQALESIGVPVPKWALLSQQNPKPNLDGFSEYVVSKPDNGGRGAEVKIRKRNRVKWKPLTTKRAIRDGNSDLLVQEFIYTGEWPVSYRVTTLFGHVLFAWKVQASAQRRPLAGPECFRGGTSAGGGMSICSSGSGCTFELINDPEILGLASYAHTAFPNHPLLGFDIVREEPGGQLFVIEANSCGHLWHFSSSTGLSIQADNGINFENQFNGLHVAAAALIEETRKRAT